MERRKRAIEKSSGIPADYAKMVSEVFTSNFDEGLKKLTKLKKSKAYFEVDGAVFPDEIVLSVSLLIGKELAATTVYGSIDYDPRASVPTIQDLLSACVDAIGNVFATLLMSDKKGELEKLAEQPLAALEGIPFEWTGVAVERFRVHLKVDKSNPNLERMADDWLSRNDPDRMQAEEDEHQETERLFVTGAEQKAKVSKKPGGNLH